MTHQSNLGLALVALIAIAPITAWAHETVSGPNGGAVVDVKGHHVEFVPSATEMTFYLTGDKDTPIASEGATVKAIVQTIGKTQQLDLVAIAPNKLSGKISEPLPSKAKVVLTGKLADGHGLQARFVVP